MEQPNCAARQTVVVTAAPIDLPEHFWQVSYAGEFHPGSASDLRRGANCQLFAYRVLQHHGLQVPPLRSSELWADTATTIRVDVPAALDLVLFSSDRNPYGAHVGVIAGPDLVLHLCREIGRPAVWSLADFAARPRYAHVIGFKRVRRDS